MRGALLCGPSFKINAAHSKGLSGGLTRRKLGRIPTKCPVECRDLFLSLNLTQDQLRWLAKNGVRINARPDVDGFRIPEPSGGLEVNSTHSAEGVMPLGVYIYSHSFARNVEYVGRYCSIGAGLKTFANTHPVDRSSTSPVF